MVNIILYWWNISGHTVPLLGINSDPSSEEEKWVSFYFQYWHTCDITSHDIVIRTELLSRRSAMNGGEYYAHFFMYGICVFVSLSIVFLHTSTDLMVLYVHVLQLIWKESFLEYCTEEGSWVWGQGYSASWNQLSLKLDLSQVRWWSHCHSTHPRIDNELTHSHLRTLCP